MSDNKYKCPVCGRGSLHGKRPDRELSSKRTCGRYECMAYAVQSRPAAEHIPTPLEIRDAIEESGPLNDARARRLLAQLTDDELRLVYAANPLRTIY